MMNSKPFFKNYLLLLLFLGMSFSGFSQTYNGKQKEIDKILANVTAFSEFYMNGDTESIVKSYTTDGAIFPGRSDILKGEEALRKYWTIPADVKVLHHKITPEEITIKGKTAYDYGYYEGKTQRPDGTISEWKGKYVVVWKKVNKEWKMYLDIWNPIE